MAGWFELNKSSENQFRFVLKAGNGEIILTSELYTSKAAAEKGIASVQSNSPQDERYEKKNSEQRQILFQSESWQSSDNRFQPDVCHRSITRSRNCFCKNQWRKSEGERQYLIVKPGADNASGFISNKHLFIDD